MRLPRSEPRIAAYEAGGLRVAALRTNAIRIVLLAGTLLLLGLTASTARGNEVSGKPLLAGGGASVVVLDLSLSIGPKDYEGIRKALRRLIDDRARVGLVIFSDVPYELMPPGTPAAELRPLLRLLAPRKKGPLNPWSAGFSAGTQISSAMEMARTMIVHSGAKHGNVLLVSDLIDSPDDSAQLARTLRNMQQESIRVRAVALSPLPTGTAIFGGLLGKKALISPEKLSTGHDPIQRGGAPLPTGLVVLAGLLLVLLAAHELFAGRLGLPQVERTQA
jgi:VWA domain-containing protein